MMVNRSSSVLAGLPWPRRARPGAVVVFGLVLSSFAAPGARPAAAQPVPVAHSTPAVAVLAPGVRAEVARAWGVDAEDVVLEWGGYRGAAPDSGTAVRIVGSGSAGHWVVRFRAGGGDPAAVRVRAGLRVTRLVAAHRIGRGAVLVPADMESAEEVAWGGREGDAVEARPGWVAQRVIKEGEPLRPPAAQPPLAVRSGRTVELVWRRDGVGLRMPGKAVGSAPLGGEVQVRTASGDRLRGVVVGPGVVDVTRGS